MFGVEDLANGVIVGVKTLEEACPRNSTLQAKSSHYLRGIAGVLGVNRREKGPFVLKIPPKFQETAKTAVLSPEDINRIRRDTGTARFFSLNIRTHPVSPELLEKLKEKYDASFISKGDDFTNVAGLFFAQRYSEDDPLWPWVFARNGGDYEPKNVFVALEDELEAYVRGEIGLGDLRTAATLDQYFGMHDIAVPDTISTMREHFGLSHRRRADTTPATPALVQTLASITRERKGKEHTADVPSGLSETYRSFLEAARDGNLDNIEKYRKRLLGQERTGSTEALLVDLVADAATINAYHRRLTLIRRLVDSGTDPSLTEAARLSDHISTTAGTDALKQTFSHLAAYMIATKRDPAATKQIIDDGCQALEDLQIIRDAEQAITTGEDVSGYLNGPARYLVFLAQKLGEARKTIQEHEESATDGLADYLQAVGAIKNPSTAADYDTAQAATEHLDPTDVAKTVTDLIIYRKAAEREIDGLHEELMEASEALRIATEQLEQSRGEL